MQRLGDYIDQIRGVSYKPADVRDENSGIAILRANNIQDKVDLSDLVYVDENKVSDVQFLKKGDVLICASSGSKNLVGKAVLIPNDMNASFGAFCKVVRIKQISEVNSDFIRMFFLSKNYRNAIAECSIGANINNIKSDHLNGLGINIPNYDIQCSAVDYLTKLKQAIDFKRKQLEDLDELVKSKFQEMFGDPVENEKGWDVKSFGELATFKNGLNYSPKGDGVKYYIIGVSDFQSRSEISCNEQLFSIYLEGTLNEEYLLQDDDILFVRSNGNKQLIARNMLVKTNMLEVTFSGFCIRARIVKSDVLPCFVNSLLKLPSSHDALTMKGRGCNISNLNQVILNDFGIIVPPIEQQKVFAEFARKADAANAIIKQEISDLEELMDSKMDEYFG